MLQKFTGWQKAALRVQTISPLWAPWAAWQQRLTFIFIGPAAAQYDKLSDPMKLQTEDAIQAVKTGIIWMDRRFGHRLWSQSPCSCLHRQYALWKFQWEVCLSKTGASCPAGVASCPAGVTVYKYLSIIRLSLPILFGCFIS